MRISCVAAAEVFLFSLFAGAALAQKPPLLIFQLTSRVNCAASLPRPAARGQSRLQEECVRNSSRQFRRTHGGNFSSRNATRRRSFLATLSSSERNSNCDRAKLQQYLEKERIASKLLEDDNAARWLAMENGATAVSLAT